MHGRLHRSMGTPLGYIKWKFDTNDKILMKLNTGYGTDAQILGD
jgi:hypothetical protein